MPFTWAEIEVSWTCTKLLLWQYLVWWQTIPAGKPSSLMGFFVGLIVPGTLCNSSPVCNMTGWMTNDYDYPNVMSYRSHNVLSFRSQNVRFRVILIIPEHPISCHTRQVLRSAALSDQSKLSSQSLSKLKTISLHQFIFQLLHNNLTFDILVCPETYVWWHLS